MGLSKHIHFGAALLAAPVFWLACWAVNILEPSLRWPIEQPLLLLKLALLYPILEEILFRGWMQERLNKILRKNAIKYGISQANLLTSLAFTSLHLLTQPFGWALLVIFPSLTFGYMKDHYQKLTPCIILHVFYNTGFLLFLTPINVSS